MDTCHMAEHCRDSFTDLIQKSTSVEPVGLPEAVVKFTCFIYTKRLHRE